MASQPSESRSLPARSPLSQSQPASAASASGGSSPFASIRGSLSGLDDIILASVLKLPQQPAGASTTKEPLSLQTTSVNFRRFVAKSGWIFVTQDAVEGVLRWESTPKTIFFAVVWAFLCVYPIGFLLVPNAALTATLLYTHKARVIQSSPNPNGNGESPGIGSGFGVGQPVEGSVDYLANLHGIQIMMGRLSDLADFGRSLLPYLTWSNERTSLVLLQLSALSTLLAAFVYPYVPWRFVFLVIGELAFVLGHPMVLGLVLSGAGRGEWEGSVKRWKRRAAELVEEDAWEEDVLRGEAFANVEQFESERWVDGQWSGDVNVGGALPSLAYRWIPNSSWSVDKVGDWAQGRVDSNGWTYLQLDGTRTKTAQGPVGSGGLSAAQSRRRRLVRRAYVPAREDASEEK